MQDEEDSTLQIHYLLPQNGFVNIWKIGIYCQTKALLPNRYLHFSNAPLKIKYIWESWGGAKCVCPMPPRKQKTQKKSLWDWTGSNSTGLCIRSKPTYAIHFVVNQLKGYSSGCLRKEFPWLCSRLPSLWTRSYFVKSVGHISEETVRKYIEKQKKVWMKRYHPLPKDRRILA